jgi:hypothetical protein
VPLQLDNFDATRTDAAEQSRELHGKANQLHDNIREVEKQIKGAKQTVSIVSYASLEPAITRSSGLPSYPHLTLSSHSHLTLSSPLAPPVVIYS